MSKLSAADLSFYPALVLYTLNSMYDSATFSIIIIIIMKTSFIRSLTGIYNVNNKHTIYSYVLFQNTNSLLSRKKVLVARVR